MSIDSYFKSMTNFSGSSLYLTQCWLCLITSLSITSNIFAVVKTEYASNNNAILKKEKE